MNDAILIAIIGAFATIVAGVPAVLIERARRENSGDHALVQRQLFKLLKNIGEVSEQVGAVDNKLEGHLKEHVGRTPQDDTTRRITGSSKISRK